MASHKEIMRTCAFGNCAQTFKSFLQSEQDIMNKSLKAQLAAPRGCAAPCQTDVAERVALQYLVVDYITKYMYCT